MNSSDRAATLSVVIPAYNEQESLRELVAKIDDSLGRIPSIRQHEIIVVDDGSSDGTWACVEQLALAPHSTVHGVRLKRNFGKAIALGAGFHAARGSIIVTLDADLQDDPDEIPKLLNRLMEGYDLVSGWKLNRQDPLEKRLPSKAFNWITRKLTHLELHDFNSGFKCYRAEAAKDIRLYGELHRFIPALVAERGYRIAEVAVHHNPRKHGKSKYGWKRYIKGLIDLLTVITITRWLRNPGHLFGGLGLALAGLGCLILFYLSAVWLFTNASIGRRPLLTFGTTMLLSGIQVIVFGLLAELIVRGQHTEDPSQYVRLRTECAGPQWPADGCQ